jgi:BirA family biotin operon repressor/biotin-[acetyl-CoA-carboxylase] ligase
MQSIYTLNAETSQAVDLRCFKKTQASRALRDENSFLKTNNKMELKSMIETDKIEVLEIKKRVMVESEIIVYDTLDSTNTKLKELAKAGAKSGTIIIAKEQTSGRGRLGRSFYSPSGSGIYMSLLLRPDENTDIGMITAYTAVAVCDALKKVSKDTFYIKWVNDIIKDGKKVCGILAESGSTDNNTNYIIVGIGINTYSPEGDFPADIQNIAGYVLDSPTQNGRNKIISEIINNFYSYSKDFIYEYKAKSCVIGKKINVHKNGTILKAEALDIDEKCNLIVKYENEETEALSFGEISIRLA